MARVLTTVDPETGAVEPGVLGRLRLRVGAYSPLVRLYRHHKPRWLWGLVNPVGRMTLRFKRQHGLTVRYGPFRGLQYSPKAVGRSAYLVPKMLGTYESSLHRVFGDPQQYSTFVDIGASDGYYCVGFARLNPEASVVGYETDRVERKLAKELATLNGVHITMQGSAGRAELASLPDSGLLLMVDIEGDERELLDSMLTPTLRTATILVETHVGAQADLVEALTARFSDTHEVIVIRGQAGSPPDFAELRGWNPGAVRLILSEGRQAHGLWMLFEPRANV